MLTSKFGPSRLAEPCFIDNCMEKFLGLNLPARNDQKPVHILKAIEGGSIAKDKLDELRTLFLKSLALEAE